MATAQTTATLRYLRMSPRKVRLLVDLVRGMNAEEAVAQLSFKSKIAARPVIKLIQSAMANAAHNHQMETSSLVIAKAFVDGGPMQYRYVPHAFGRATPIRKRTAHITVVLEGQVMAGKPKKSEVIEAEIVPEEKLETKEKEKKVTKKAVTKKATPKKSVKSKKS